MLEKLLTTFVAVVAVMGNRTADQRDVANVLDQYAAVRPTNAELGIYELDWSPTLQAAKERAAKEGRPIFLVVVLNSFGNICTGHC